MRSLLISVVLATACVAPSLAASKKRTVPHVEARAWFVEFRENYIAAERKYPYESDIILRGVVAEIRPPKSAAPGMDDPVLMFGGASVGWWIWAPVDKDYAATVRPGQTVILACKVMSFSSGGKVLAGVNDCSPAEP